MLTTRELPRQHRFIVALLDEANLLSDRANKKVAASKACWGDEPKLSSYLLRSSERDIETARSLIETAKAVQTLLEADLPITAIPGPLPVGPNPFV